MIRICIAMLCVSCTAEVDGSGEITELQSQTVRWCFSSATLDRYLAGTGAAEIRVSDGAGTLVYDVADDVTGEVDDSRDLGGASGEWRLEVDAQGFAGQLEISLDCL